MKKVCFYFFACLVVSFTLLSLSCKNHAGNEPEGNFNEPEGDFVEFTLESDLSWLEGEWELEKWEGDNHGEVSDYTFLFTYELLKIQGGTKDSVLIDETKGFNDESPKQSSWTVESYLFANTLISNKVNRERNVIQHVRENALDPEVVFYFTYRKR